MYNNVIDAIFLTTTACLTRLPDQPTAADVVNMLDQEDLYQIMKRYGEEKLAKHISHAIVETRYAFGNITRTKQLADIIAGVFSRYEGGNQLQKCGWVGWLCVEFRNNRGYWMVIGCTV